MKKRLSAMMFLQYAVGGFTLPILSHYLLHYLHFEADQAGLVMAMSPLAAIIAPFVMVHIADRLVSAERLLGLCHLGAGCVMLALARESVFSRFLPLYLLYGLMFVPTFALTNAVAFHHLKDAKREFGAIRMWGPISWVVVAFAFSLLWLRGEPADAPGSRLAYGLCLSALTSFVLGLYAFTLPRSQAAGEAAPKKGMAILQAARVFARPGLVLLCALAFLNSVVHQAYYFGMSPYLSQIGLANKYIMPAMSMGQLGEVFVLMMLGRSLARLGVKRALMIGIFTQVIRCLVFASGRPLLSVLVIPTHGVCYAFFFTAAYIYLDSHSSPQDRSGAQQIFNILIMGFGQMAGNLCAGGLAKALTDAETGLVDFGRFWLAPAVLALVLTAVLALFFREETPASAKPEARG